MTTALTAFELIESAAGALRERKEAYLRRFGWTCTSNTPGAYWLWRRDFQIEDFARHRRWLERGPGPMGWPSEPRPWGVITAGLDLAVQMTAKTLDPHPLTTIDED